MCRIKHISHTQEHRKTDQFTECNTKTRRKTLCKPSFAFAISNKRFFLFQSTMHTHSHIRTHLHIWSEKRAAAAAVETATTTGTTINGWMKWFHSKIDIAYPLKLKFYFYVLVYWFEKKKKDLRTFVATHYIWFHV